MSAEKAFEFVDTNILVYAHDPSALEKGRVAQELIRRLWDEGSGCLSVQILQEFFVAVTRKAAGRMGLDEAEAIVRNLSFWKVQTPSAKDVLGAIEVQRQYQISFWDAMVVQSAAQSACPILWSEDLNPGQVYNEVLVKNPFLAPD